MINVIIPHYNHETYLPDALTGILAQHGADEKRVLLFNDQPGVNLAPYEHLYRLQVQVFSDGENRGQSFRFNQGIDYSIASEYLKSDWVCFHGADDISLPYRFENFNMYLANIMAGQWPDIVYTDAVLLREDQSRQYIRSKVFDLQALRQGNYIVASTVFVRTSFLADHSEVRFDGGIHYGEDWLFYHRAAKAGARFNYMPIPTVLYRDYTSNIGVRYGADWEAKKAELRNKINYIWTPKTN